MKNGSIKLETSKKVLASQNFYIEKLVFPKGWWVLSAK